LSSIIDFFPSIFSVRLREYMLISEIISFLFFFFSFWLQKNKI